VIFNVRRKVVVGATLSVLITASCITHRSPVSDYRSEMSRVYKDFHDRSHELVLRIELEKQSYLVGEPIWVDVTLSNAGADTVVMPGSPMALESSEFEFYVITNGERLKYTGPVACGALRPMPIAPGQEFHRCFDILSNYGEPVPNTTSFEPIVSAGTYSIHADSWGVLSNEVGFDIEKPQGRDAEIYEILEQAISLSVNNRRLTAAQQLEELLPGLAGSPYRDKVVYWLGNMWWFFEIDKELEIFAQLVDVSPNSGYAPIAVGRLMRKMTLPEAEMFWWNLQRKAPGSRAAQAAQSSLSSPAMPWNKQRHEAERRARLGW
jgi:hypothetical protein